MSQQAGTDRLVELRRELHRRPETAWTEFWTTARIVEELERIGVDEVHVGRDALAPDERMGVPDDEEIAAAFERAREAGAPADLLAEMEGGYTGAVAVLEKGEGPTVALRVDIDGLPRRESDDEDHVPAGEGFRSVHEGAMHACGHDGHATIGIGVLERIEDSDFEGTLKVCFQPAEEVIGGGKAVAESGHLDDVDYLLALHLGLSHPTGEVVAGIDGFLSVSHVEVEFHGEGGHAGARPNEGRNAVQALATAVENLYGIARHEEGATRVNAGKIEGGTASNIIPEYARMEAEVRGASTELKDYTKGRAETVVESAAAMHDCEATFETGPEAPGGHSDDGIRELVSAAAAETDGVDSIVESDELGGSEDATYMMETVQSQGGLAAYVGIGTDHPGGHHSATFDVDERSLDIGVDVIAGAIERIGRDPPPLGED
jgi:aminobenzoyl-glutamate utilization protein A